MRIIKIFPIIILFTMLICSCTSSKNSRTDVTDNYDEDSHVVTTSHETLTIIEEPKRFYYNKLYEYLCNDGIYTGELSKLDRSLLEGYEFIGLTASKVEYDEIPDKNLVSSVYDKGIPVLYNETKDDFIFWFQEDNYWVELIEILPIDE